MKLSRLFAVPATLGAMALALAVGATPAQAAVTDPKCVSTTTYNACLRFLPAGADKWKALAGLDEYMPQSYADEILRHGGGYFSGQLYADDSYDVVVADLELEPGWPSTGPAGLGVEMSATLPASVLDEDDGVDEFYAKITFYDYHRGEYITRTTGVVRYEFGEADNPCLIPTCP